MQNYHSLLYREEEREMLAVCKVDTHCFLSPHAHLISCSVWAQSHGLPYPEGCYPVLAMRVMIHCVARQTRIWKGCSRETTLIM